MSQAPSVCPTFYERVLTAAATAGLSRGQFCRRMGWPREWLDGGDLYYRRDILLVAQVCDVDPRWLVTGEVSRAGQKVIRYLRQRFDGRETVDVMRLIGLIEMHPEQFEGFGVCRYCLRQDQAWANEDQTVCKPCVMLDTLEDA